MWYRLIFLLYCLNAASVSRKQQLYSDITKFTIQMIGYSPAENDEYVAVSRQAPEGYIVAFEPFAHADRVHHMLLFGCTEPARASTFWRGGMTCGGRGASHILYAWAKNAPNLVLPHDVAFSVGHANDGILYLVLQVHYAQPFVGDVRDFSGVTLHMSSREPKNLAAVLLFASGEPIPPGRNQVQINMSCEYNGDIELHPFAFRTHTHAMGRVVSAYYKHNEMWNKIGIRNPQWPQLFEKISNVPVIRRGDLLAATCRFDSHDKTRPVPMGSMGTNEMCNFYMMFYWDSTKRNPFQWGAVCSGIQRQREVMYEYPKEGTELLPSRPDLEHHAHQSAIPFGVVEESALTTIGDVKLGQVVGLSFMENNIVIFHRGGRVWDQSTFDQDNVLVDKTPIKEDVILIASIEGNQTRIVKKLGKNKFYLPHGIHVDKHGFLYTTDLGSHTVAKWKINEDELDLIWESGEKLVPNGDGYHFCKPTAVVELNEDIFVSDGYCNSKIVQLDGATGKRKYDFGQPGNGPSQFNLPHDIVLTTGTADHLLVADRENGRVQELSTRGDFIMEWASSLFTNIYSIDAHDGYIFMVPGRRDQSGPIHVYVGRVYLGFYEYSFGPTSRPFGMPHVIRVTADGHRILVGDAAIGKSTLWVFRIQREHDPPAMGGSMWHSSHVKSTSTGNSGILLSLVFAALVIGLVVLCRRQLTRVFSRGHPNFDRKVSTENIITEC
ncbi:hypothetical protein KIN20_036260 [Parelaphostrongylus tenuis]|uniref:Peptidylglycine monooxygenase n=1 Tax=Parelaphostrongylus tenuis TaxID=148309 RepID=A0AAD5RCY0_PARTN|nr:hypothetical protein KIN20_036260 [Parelaphostrongylus tenuis]